MKDKNNKENEIMPETKLIVGNWKMNGHRHTWKALTEEIINGAKGLKSQIVLCPPFLGIGGVLHMIEEAESAVKVGAQNVARFEQGAHTGDISAQMLKDVGCAYSIVGHSERRLGHGETDKRINLKAILCVESNISPILCVGETETEKAAHQTFQVLEDQLEQGLENVPFNQNCPVVVAYEPVWCIGTGSIPDAAQIKEIFRFLRRKLEELYDEYTAQDIFLLYGGSVNGENAAEILHIENVDGVLVGGASLQSESFLAIAKAAE